MLTAKDFLADSLPKILLHPRPHPGSGSSLACCRQGQLREFKCFPRSHRDRQQNWEYALRKSSREEKHYFQKRNRYSCWLLQLLQSRGQFRCCSLKAIVLKVLPSDSLVIQPIVFYQLKIAACSFRSDQRYGEQACRPVCHCGCLSTPRITASSQGSHGSLANQEKLRRRKMISNSILPFKSHASDSHPEC